MALITWLSKEREIHMNTTTTVTIHTGISDIKQIAQGLEERDPNFGYINFNTHILKRPFPQVEWIDAETQREKNYQFLSLDNDDLSVYGNVNTVTVQTLLKREAEDRGMSLDQLIDWLVDTDDLPGVSRSIWETDKRYVEQEIKEAHRYSNTYRFWEYTLESIKEKPYFQQTYEILLETIDNYHIDVIMLSGKQSIENEKNRYSIEKQEEHEKKYEEEKQKNRPFFVRQMDASGKEWAEDFYDVLTQVFLSLPPKKLLVEYDEPTYLEWYKNNFNNDEDGEQYRPGAVLYKNVIPYPNGGTIYQLHTPGGKKIFVHVTNHDIEACYVVFDEDDHSPTGAQIVSAYQEGKHAGKIYLHGVCGDEEYNNITINHCVVVKEDDDDYGYIKHPD